jgi:hypothetical protein
MKTDKSWLFWALLAAGAAATRAAFLSHWPANFDADECLVAVQASEILQGRFSLFLPGQCYMGSLQALVAAPLLALFGRHPNVVRLSPLLWLVPGFLALRALQRLDLANAAGSRTDAHGPGMAAAAGDDRKALPGDHRARSLALQWFFPPAVLFLAGVKARGGNLEAVVLGLAAMALLWPRKEKTSAGRRTLGTLAAGLLLGLGLWTHDSTALFLPLALLLVLAERGRIWVRYLALLGGWAAGYLPLWLPHLVPFSLGPPGLEGSGWAFSPAAGLSGRSLLRAASLPLATAATAFKPGLLGGLQVLYALLLAGSALFALWAWLRPPRARDFWKRRPALTVTLWLALGTAAALLFSAEYCDDPQWFRYTIGLAPFFALSASLALERLSGRRWWGAAMGLALLSGCVSLSAVPAWELPQATERPALVAQLLQRGAGRVETDWTLAYALRFLSRDRILASSRTPPRFPEINARVDLAPAAWVVLPATGGSKPAPGTPFFIAPRKENPPPEVGAALERLDLARTLFPHFEPFPLLQPGQFRRDWRGWPYRRPLKDFRAIVWESDAAAESPIAPGLIEQALDRLEAEGEFRTTVRWAGGRILERPR